MGTEIPPRQDKPFDYTQWAKQRALQYVDQGDLKEAINSLISDLNKDPSRLRTEIMMAAAMGMDLKKKADLTKEEVVEWINGFRSLPEETAS